MKKKFIFLLVFILLALVLNFAWENLQFPLYNSVLSFKSIFGFSFNSLFSIALYASLIDAFWITAVYLLIAIIDKNIRWELNKVNLILFSITLILIAMIMERFGLSSGRWSYSSLVPIIFGIGLSPLIQLAVTGLIGLLVSRKLSV